MIGIHPARIEACPALADIHRQGFDPAWSAEEIRSLMDGLGALAFSAGPETSPVGFVLCRIAADEAEVLTIATRPDHRRQGVASALLDTAMAAVLASGAASMFLEVAVDNLAALALYRSHGFDAVGRRPGYYSRPGGPIDAMIMRVDLNI